MHVVRHLCVEVTRARDRFFRVEPALRDGGISGGVEGGQLLQHQRLSLLEIDVEFLRDMARFLDGSAPSIETLTVLERSRSCRVRDVKIRLAGAHEQVHRVLFEHLAPTEPAPLSARLR